MSKPQLIPFYQYWRRVKCDHFYTTDLTEIDEYVPGETGENFAKASGVCCLILSAPDPRYGCVPLHRYYTSDRIIKGLDKDEKKDDCKANHLYTIKPESDGLSVPNDGKDEDGNGLLVTQLKALAKKEKLNLIVTQHDSGDFTKYIYEGIAGYVYKDNPPTGAVPLNRFKCKTDTYLDYFYTTSGDQDKVLKQEDSCFFTDAVVNEYLSTPASSFKCYVYSCISA